eukprot:5092274-Ditylum_brightwellii.AAC.1
MIDVQVHTKIQEELEIVKQEQVQCEEQKAAKHVVANKKAEQKANCSVLEEVLHNLDESKTIKELNAQLDHLKCSLVDGSCDLPHIQCACVRCINTETA